ncbi:hypothetical protein MPG45_05285 [Helicobacter pylori]|nr:hypothetical protein MPG45_05285 [Helicobacter pylori]
MILESPSFSYGEYVKEGNYPISEEQMLDFMEMGVEPKGKQEMKLELKNSLENEVNKSKEN